MYRIGFLALCLLTATAASAAGSRRASMPAPRLRAAPGWVVVKPTKTEQPGLYASMIVAVTASDLRAVHPFVLFTGFKRLSKRGIIVWVTTIGHDRPTFKPMAWPPLLAGFRVDHGWEGQPAANIQQRLKWGVVHGWDMDVRVYFATQHPDTHLLREAQAELDRLILPSR